MAATARRGRRKRDAGKKPKPKPKKKDGCRDRRERVGSRVNRPSTRSTPGANHRPRDGGLGRSQPPPGRDRGGWGEEISDPRRTRRGADARTIGDALPRAPQPFVSHRTHVMAALGSAMRATTILPSARAFAGRKHAKKAQVSTVTRAASAEKAGPKIVEVAAAVDHNDLLPEGLYCNAHYQTTRRKTRCARARRPDARPRARAIERAERSQIAARREERDVDDQDPDLPLPPSLPRARSQSQDGHHRRRQARQRSPDRPPDDDDVGHARRRGHRRGGESRAPAPRARVASSFSTFISLPYPLARARRSTRRARRSTRARAAFDVSKASRERAVPPRRDPRGRRRD